MNFSHRVDLFIGLVTSAATGLRDLDPQVTLSRTAAHLAAYHIDGFTAIQAHGYWCGNPEPSLNVIYFTDDPSKATDIAEELAVAFNQEAVLVSVTPTDGRLVFAPTVS
jgi:hypothetical protein